MRESPSRGGKNIASPPLLRPCLFAFFSFVLGKCADLPPPQLSFSSWLFFCFILGEKYVPTPPFPVRCKRAVKAGRKNKCFFPFFFSPSKEHQNLRGILTFDLAAKKENQSRTECLHPSLPHTYKTGKKSFLDQGDDNEIHEFGASESPRKMCTYKQLSRVIAGRVDVATCKYTRVFYFSCYVVQHKMPPYLQLRIGRFSQKIESTKCAIFGMRA